MKKAVVVPLELNAMFTGDSTNYHVFQIATEDKVLGSVYIDKKTDAIPESVKLSLVTPGRNKKEWRKGMNILLDKTREGSRAETKLIKIMKSNE